MAVRYESIDGELVSQEWATFLRNARHDGVQFHVNEGHRTFARQTYFWNCYKCGCCNNGNLAARPSCNAPHIRCDRKDHAIDADNMQGLINYGAKHGVTIRRTVAGELWHGEASLSDLVRFHLARQVANPCEVLSNTESKLVAKLFYHRKGMLHSKGAVYAKNLAWARYYKSRLNAQAATLYALGLREGWKKLHRGARRKLIRQIVTNGERLSC